MTASVEPTKASNRPKRAYCSHVPKWQRYQPTLLRPETKKAQQKDKETYQYQRQYSHVYSNRLAALKPRCWKQFDASQEEKFTKVNRVLELREDIPSRVVGTLVKECNDPKETPLQPKTKCRSSDQLYLEDESGRVVLQLDTIHHYCTGVVVGVQGKVDKLGTFHVEELVLPAPPTQPNLTANATVIPATIPDADDSNKAPHVLLVSSLLCGDPNVSSLPREMLVGYLQGQFTTDAAKVCRVLLVGGGPSKQEPLQGVKDLDAFCLQLTKAGIPVDIMPGKDDPTTANWPQRPLHSSLLPHATAIVHRAPNPYAAALGEKLIVATDGANIHDLQTHVLTKTDQPEATPESSQDADDETGGEGTLWKPCSELEALQRTLEWSHVCPNGPDSIPTVPHLDQDPMVLDQRPHLYVCGNATKFATTTVGSTTMVCLPKFSEAGEAALVNLETNKIELLRFEDQQA